MSIEVVVGANWGDEGKGRMVDYLAQDADFVVRFQGGNNAGHTVVNEFGMFKLHLLPSGVFNPKAVNVLGPGMVIDLQGLAEEIADLKGKASPPTSHSPTAPRSASPSTAWKTPGKKSASATRPTAPPAAASPRPTVIAP